MRRSIITVLVVLFFGVTGAVEDAVNVRVATTGQGTQSGEVFTDAITIPRMISYQGRLTDTLGRPVPDGDYQLTFRLYTQESGGTPFWNEVQTVAVRNGLFSVLLGLVNPITSIPDAGGLYLGLQVGSEPELSPRLRIVSGAYAYLAERAADADRLQGKDTTGFVRTGQASSVTSAMIVDGTIAGADINRMGASTGQVLKWNGTLWTPANDSAGGVPSGPAGGDLTGTYPNPTIASDAVTSAKILDRSIRGIDLAKPCTLTAALNSPQAILKLRNSGTGHGVVIESVGSSAMRIEHARGYGIYINRAGSDGVVVYRAGNYGLYVDSVAHSGVFVSTARYYGLYITRAGTNGIFVSRSGGSGVHVDSAATYGVYSVGATAGGRFMAENANAEGIYVHTYGNNATDTAVVAYGRGYATGGWFTGGLLGDKEAPCIISSDLTIVAYGTGKLVDGSATIEYPDIFRENIRSDVPVTITVTPRGKPAGLLYVSEQDFGSFRVEMAAIAGLSGEREVAFNWVAFGTLKEYETSPGARAEWERLMQERQRR